MKRLDINQIEFRSACFQYDVEKKIIDRFNFCFQKDNTYYLQGPKGSGKNTLIKLLLGLEPLSSGDYVIDHTVVSHFTHKEFDLYRLNMGYAFDNGGLLNNHTLYENFKIILDYHDFNEVDHRSYIISLLRKFDIDDVNT
jgi:phospholipid/cholesterol/gamma-HCH transport system ATP-binding protein